MESYISHVKALCAGWTPPAAGAGGSGPEASGPEVRDITASNGGRLASEAISPIAR